MLNIKSRMYGIESYSLGPHLGTKNEVVFAISGGTNFKSPMEDITQRRSKKKEE